MAGSDDNMNSFFKVFIFICVFSCPQAWLRQAASLVAACKIFGFPHVPDQDQTQVPLHPSVSFFMVKSGRIQLTVKLAGAATLALEGASAPPPVQQTPPLGPDTHPTPTSSILWVPAPWGPQAGRNLLVKH